MCTPIGWAGAQKRLTITDECQGPGGDGKASPTRHDRPIANRTALGLRASGTATGADPAAPARGEAPELQI